MTRRAVLWIAAIALRIDPLLSDDHVYSVCSVLKNLKKLDHRLVRIHGTVHSGLEDYSLRDSCDFRLKTGAFTWPPAIWLTGPAMAESPIDFQPDMKSIQRLSDLLKAKTRDFSAEVAATVEGRLEAHPLRTGVGGNGQVIGMGYGHLGGFPAQLVIKSVVIEPLQ